MSLRILGPVCLIAVCPLIAVAQETSSAEVAVELESIKQQLRTLSENLTKTVETVAEHETQIGQLKNQLATLTTQINDEIAKQQQILDAIAQTDSSGRHVPRLSAAMQSQEFQQEMHQAVHDSLGQSGTLRITNKTAQYQQIFVNRQQHGVGAGEILTLKVPVGTVTTEIPGREIKNWTVTAPNYEQNVELVPTSTPITTYVARPIYTPPPVYYNPYPFTSNFAYYWP